MSEKMTAVYLPGRTSGFADWGDHEPVDMIRRIREDARRDLETAQVILEAPDEAFVVETYYGPVAQRGRKQIWPAA